MGEFHCNFIVPLNGIALILCIGKNEST